MKGLIEKRLDLIKKGIAPKGYKKTAIGIIPNDWAIERLGDLFKFSGGLGIPRHDLSDGGFPYLHYGDMHCSDNTAISYDEYLLKPKYKAKLTGNETYLINDGDIIFLDASEDLEGTSRMVLVNNPCNRIFISGLHTIIAKPKKEILVNKYKQFLTFPQCVKKQFTRLSSGFKVYGINRESIKSIFILFPKDKNEQEKIAQILIKVNENVKYQIDLISKLELQKKSLVKRLFKSQNSWISCFFKDLYIKAGEGGTPSTSKKEYYDSGKIPFIKIEHLVNKYLIKIDSYINEKGLKNSGAWLIPENSLIFSNGATIGQASINKIPVTTKQGILGIVPNDRVSVEFLYYMVTSSYFLCKVKSITTRGTMFTAYLKDLDNIKVQIPDKKEQNRIVSILSKLDENIDLNKEKLSKIKKQQKSLMQLLLTGIIRVD